MSKNVIEILHEDDQIIAVNKIAGITVTKDRSGKDGIITLLQKQLKTEKPFKLIHSLDKDASGVMILAKDTENQSKYASMLSKQQIIHRYLALVEGPMSSQHGTVKHPIARSKVNDITMVISPRRGAATITKWSMVADFGGICLLEVQPLTIRTHQIQVHLKSIGSPLVVDPIYGSAEGLMLSRFKYNYKLAKSQVEKPLIDRLTLHSYEIVIPETESTHHLRISAKPEKKFAAAIKMLTKYNVNKIAAFENQDNFQRILNGQEPS